MNPDGSGQIHLTNNQAWEGEPAVSPDGRRIAFVTDRHGCPGQEEIYVSYATDTDGDGDAPLRLANLIGVLKYPLATWCRVGFVIRRARHTSRRGA